MTNANGTGQSARILVVDDEENIRRLLGLTLKRLSGFDVTVDTAGTAEEGKKLLDSHPYHILISDYRMPGRTGVDLLAYAHQARPDTARMLITAYGEMDIGVDAVNRGRVDGFLRKPWDGRQLVALVESLLQTRVGAAGGAGGAPALGPAGAPAPGGAPAGPGAYETSMPAPAHAGPGAYPAQQPTGAAAPAATAVPSDPGEIEQELRSVDKALRQLRVRLGLGGISPEGYQRANSQLTERKAALEMALLRIRDGP